MYHNYFGRPWLIPCRKRGYTKYHNPTILRCGLLKQPDEGEWGRILGIGAFLADRKDDLDCDHSSSRNRVYLGADRTALAHDHIIELAGSGAKRKGLRKLAPDCLSGSCFLGQALFPSGFSGCPFDLCGGDFQYILGCDDGEIKLRGFLG